ncbi:hypothetical protein KFE25_014308 [Diacronema lutheri]|uniref:Uncharacterized protein n=1 Tax=Diacronema lutheri TaxID=2081491 RepID=A0A8J6CA64_DIALT|nr:hypothetical protein KFE25_014308 [Diacronema lutheri]
MRRVRIAALLGALALVARAGGLFAALEAALALAILFAAAFAYLYFDDLATDHFVAFFTALLGVPVTAGRVRVRPDGVTIEGLTIPNPSIDGVKWEHYAIVDIARLRVSTTSALHTLSLFGMYCVRVGPARVPVWLGTGVREIERMQVSTFWLYVDEKEPAGGGPSRSNLGYFAERLRKAHENAAADAQPPVEGPAGAAGATAEVLAGALAGGHTPMAGGRGVGAASGGAAGGGATDGVARADGVAPGAKGGASSGAAPKKASVTSAVSAAAAVATSAAAAAAAAASGCAAAAVPDFSKAAGNGAAHGGGRAGGLGLSRGRPFCAGGGSGGGEGGMPLHVDASRVQLLRVRSTSLHSPSRSPPPAPKSAPEAGARHSSGGGGGGGGDGDGGDDGDGDRAGGIGGAGSVAAGCTGGTHGVGAGARSPAKQQQQHTATSAPAHGSTLECAAACGGSSSGGGGSSGGGLPGSSLLSLPLDTLRRMGERQKATILSAVHARLVGRSDTEPLQVPVFGAHLRIRELEFQKITLQHGDNTFRLDSWQLGGGYMGDNTTFARTVLVGLTEKAMATVYSSAKEAAKGTAAAGAATTAATADGRDHGAVRSGRPFGAPKAVLAVSARLTSGAGATACAHAGSHGREPADGARDRHSTSSSGEE